MSQLRLFDEVTELHIEKTYAIKAWQNKYLEYIIHCIEEAGLAPNFPLKKSGREFPVPALVRIKKTGFVGQLKIIPCDWSSLCPFQIVVFPIDKGNNPTHYQTVPLAYGEDLTKCLVRKLEKVGYL